MRSRKTIRGSRAFYDSLFRTTFPAEDSTVRRTFLGFGDCGWRLDGYEEHIGYRFMWRIR